MKAIPFRTKIGKKIVCSLWFYQIKFPDRHVGVIEYVETDPEYRNQGLATALIKRAIAHAARVRCTCVELTVREDRTDLQKFYKELGFEDRLNRAMRLRLV